MKTLHLSIIISALIISTIVIAVGIIQSQTVHEELSYMVISNLEPSDVIDKEQGIVTISNRTFHVMNLDNLPHNSSNAIDVTWYGVRFYFPHGLQPTSTPDGKIFESYVTFPDNPSPVRMKIGQNSPSVGYYASAFTTHANPQAGVMLHNDTIQLLVNWSKINPEIAINNFNDTYKTGQPINFQIKVSGFDYFDEGQTPKIWIERQNGSLAWSPPHKDSIVLCCAPELTDYDKKFNLTDLGGPIRIDKPGTYNLVVSYNSQKIQKQFSVVQPPTEVYDNGIFPLYANVTNTNFTVNYDITQGQVSEIKLAKPSGALEILLQTTGDGVIIIDIPRALIDARETNFDDQFFVLADGEEISFKEIHKTIQDRTLSIPFRQGTEKIEIIGTYPI